MQRNRNLPQIESRFPICFPNLARSLYQCGMITAAQIFHRLLESRKSNFSNTLMARALHEFLRVSGLSDNLRRERIFLNAPHWHNACNCRCNGRKHESSRTQLSDSHPVSLVSHVASRRFIPGLCRTRSPATAPSLKYYGDGRTGYRVRPAWRDANFHRDGQQYGEHVRELEREWNSRRECDGGNDRCGRRLHGSGKSSRVRFRFRAGHERGGHLQDFGFARDNFEQHFRFSLSSDDAGRAGRHAAIHGHGEFSRQSQSGHHLDSFRQRMH